MKPYSKPKRYHYFWQTHTHQTLTHSSVYTYVEREKGKNPEVFKKQVYTGMEILPERYIQYVTIKSKSRISKLQATGAKSRLYPVFINTVLLKHSHTNLYELSISASATQRQI